MFFAVFITALGSALYGQKPQDKDLLVTMPQPPETITRLEGRCNFIVDKFWQTFNPKSSFSSLDRLDYTMGTFFGFVPYATADTVHMAIDRLIDNVRKASPQNLVTLAKLAEKWTFTDSAEYMSEELYFPFVEAVATDKKAKGPERPRFVHHYNQLKNSRVGSTVENLVLKTPDGGKLSLDSIRSPHIILFFYDPDCSDCRMARVRLSADPNLKEIIDKGMLSIVAIYPGEDDAAWRKEAQSLPSNWRVGSLENADERFTLRNTPEIYYLNRKHRVLAKDIAVDNVMRAFRQQ